METVVTEIEQKCHEKLMIYNDLLNLFRQEKKSIVKGDVTALWEFSSDKREKAKSIEKIRTDMLEILENSGIEHGMTLSSFKFENLVDLFSGEDLRRLTEKLIAINRLKAEIQTAGNANREFVSEYLATINDLVDVFAGNTFGTGLYNRKSCLNRTRENDTVLFSREV